jgi:DNA-binding NarL/FixJ family response regulator
MVHPAVAMAGMKPISILLADDHNVVREGLRALLSAEPDIEIVGEASNGWQAVKVAKEKSPGIVIMDLAMPDLNGLEATRQVMHELPSTRIIILTSYGDDEYVKQMVEAGVAGYLKKQTAAQDLIKAIREVHRGNVFFSPSVARRLRDQSRAQGNPSGRTQGQNQLTVREGQVLRLIAQGAANKQMAADLGISVKTIEKHRQHLMKKLGIHDIASLTRYAAEKGIIRVGPEPELEGDSTKMAESLSE